MSHATRRSGQRWWAGAVVAAALVFGSVTAPASAEEGPFGTVRTWEVQEFLKLRSRGHDGDSRRLVSRMADASLVGVAEGQICQLAGTASPCVVGVRATSRVSFATFRGPFEGTLSVLVDNPTMPGPDDVLVVSKVTIRGTLDFCPDPLHVSPITGLCNGTGLPFGLVQGTWRSRDLNASGTLSGLFQFPIPTAFVLPEYLVEAGICDVNTQQSTLTGADPVKLSGHVYVDPQQNVRCLAVEEYSLANPLVLFTAAFEQTGHAKGGD